MFRRAPSVLAAVATALLAVLTLAMPAEAAGPDDPYDRDCLHVARPTGGETLVCIPALVP